MSLRIMVFQNRLRHSFLTTLNLITQQNGSRSELGNFREYSRKYAPPGPLSYLSVPGEVPLLDLTMGQLIDQAAFKYGNQEAIVVSSPREVRKTFVQVKNEVDNLAGGLLSIGLKKGDRVGLWGPNSYEWYLTHAAGMKAGLIIVNINPGYQTREVGYCLQKVGIKCMVIAEQFKSSNYYDLMVATVPEIPRSEPNRIRSTTAPQLTTLVTFAAKAEKGAFSFEEVVDRGTKEESRKVLRDTEKLVQFDDVCNIQFTSGTTGNPKGVMLSHHNIVNNGFLCGRRFSYSEKDKLCIPVPFFHCFGSVVGITAGLHSGATAVFPSPAFSPTEILQSIAKERCTVLYGTPTMHIDVLHTPEFKDHDVSSLRLAVTAGAICPEELIRHMKTKYTVDNVTSVYGMTETSPASFQSLSTDTDKLRAETVGYPLENTEVKVIDTQGRIVPVGKEGELCIRGYLNMVGYWEDPEKTCKTIDSTRWLHTGEECPEVMSLVYGSSDLVVLNESGHARIVGRLKDMIIRGGENVYPREIEDFLHSHPEVQEAHVFGVPDTRMGEEIAVWVSLKEGHVITVEELKSFCKGKIAHFKIPRFVTITKDFPVTTSGKIQKFKMREMTIEKFTIEDKFTKI